MVPLWNGRSPGWVRPSFQAAGGRDELKRGKKKKKRMRFFDTRVEARLARANRWAVRRAKRFHVAANVCVARSYDGMTCLTQPHWCFSLTFGPRRRVRSRGGRAAVARGSGLTTSLCGSPWRGVLGAPRGCFCSCQWLCRGPGEATLANVELMRTSPGAPERTPEFRLSNWKHGPTPSPSPWSMLMLDLLSFRVTCQ